MAQRRIRSILRRTVVLASCVAAVLAGVVAVRGMGEDGLRALVRASARTSAFTFLVSTVFPPSNGRGSPFRLGDGAGPWLLAFGISHLVHLAALSVLATAFPQPFWSEFRAAPVLAGAGPYGVLGILCLRVLGWSRGSSHWVTAVEGWGPALLWAAFAAAYVPRLPAGGLVSLLGLMSLAAPSLRFAAFRRRHSQGGGRRS